MLVRLAFATQVHVDPDILIIDEALAVGDALFQKRCYQKIEQILSRGTTVIIVSHDQELIRTLTNRSLLLVEGKQWAYGKSSEVILEYRKRLHEEESIYYANILDSASKKSNKTNRMPLSTDDIVLLQNYSHVFSFGNGEAKILHVETFDQAKNPCANFYSGEVIYIKITCKAHAVLNNLNIGIRIRNKEGYKIYSWGTLNQDMHRYLSKTSEQIFWERHFDPNDIFDVEFQFICNVGANFYEIQASISHECSCDYKNQHILHWIDEAAFFQVLVNKDDHFFGGLIDLKMRATW